MADSGFNKDDFEKMKKELSEMHRLQEDITRNMGTYNDYVKKVQDAFRDVKVTRNGIKEADNEINRLVKERNALLKTGKTVHDKEVKAVDKLVDEHKQVRDVLKEQLPYLERSAQTMAQQLNTANKIKATWGSIGDKVKENTKALWRQRGEFMKTLGTVRETELSMGILSKQAGAFRDNMYKASLNTNMLGVNTRDLAKMQGQYSQQVGRTVMLTQEGLTAMAELASGTILGTDGAAQMAADMETFGISAVGTKDIIEEMLNTSHKMGVNSAKAIKNMQQNLRLANRYHFKDGAAGIARMSVAAAKLKLDIEGIAGMADQVFRPEGAVNMAASLQTMGGEFAKLANPFELMFKARNDFEGFAMEIGSATKEFVKFNKETGEFDISGLMLDRMREISTITGINVDKLSEMGREASKFDMIGKMLSPNIDKDTQEFITSIAQFDKKKGEWYINMGNGKKTIQDLNRLTKEQLKAQVDAQVKEKASLEERAKQAQTFDKTWKNLENTFKATLLPFVEEIDQGLKPVLNDLMNYFQENQIPQKIGEFAKSAGELAKGVIKWIADNPLKSIVGGVLGKAMFDIIKWRLAGVQLGIGFNSVASAGGGGGMMDMLGGGRGRGFNRMGRLAKAGFKGGGLRGGITGLGRGMKGFGGSLKGLGGGVAGMGLGLAGMGLDMYRGGLEDQHSGTAQALGVGSSALTGAGIGATIGSIIPGLGTAIGAAIGGALGGAYGLYDEWSTSKEAKSGTKFHDYIVQNGKISSIDPNDVNIGVKDGGVVDKLLGDGGNNTPGSMEVSFKPLKVEFSTIKLEGKGGNSIDIDITSDPILMRELSNVIQQELRKAIGGGKLNPNPIG